LRERTTSQNSPKVWLSFCRIP
jgi:hypothetical protein